MTRFWSKGRSYGYVLIVGWLTLVWVMLWGELSLGNVLVGMILGILVTIVFPLPGMEFNGRIRPVGFAILFARMARDLVITSFQVVRQVINPGSRIESVVVGIRLHTNNELLITWIAICITLTPGSVIVEAHQATGDLYVHLLGVTTEAEIQQARDRIYSLEYRVVHAFGSKAELDQCRKVQQLFQQERIASREGNL